MNYWLVKSDPETYSWEDFRKEKVTSWDGIRNYAARIHLKAMKKGDNILVYHSGGESAVLGTAKVTKEYYDDPTSEEVGWVSVELKAEKPLKRIVTLKEIKADTLLKHMVLVKISRLSVSRVSKEEFEKIISLGSE